MGKCIFNNGRIVGENERPFFIAEVNTSHYGKIDKAIEMIDAAKEAGCDCVKFQSWSAESLYSKTYYEENPFAKRMVSRFALCESDLLILAEYCKEKEIGFSSTPYSIKEVDFLVDECCAPFVKIASMDLDNDDFLKYVAKKDVAIVLSTGMSTYEEVEHAVNILEKDGVNNLCLLHCVSVYPPDVEDIRLKNIVELKRRFPQYAIGFSDHSIGQEMSCAAIALGASVIEKHLTMDSTKIGMDNQMATEPKKMKELVENCCRIHDALGGSERIISKKEEEMRVKMRRSLIAKTDIEAGTILTEEMIDAKRPGTGLPLCMKKEIIGKSVNRKIDADTVMYKEDIVFKGEEK